MKVLRVGPPFGAPLPPRVPEVPAERPLRRRGRPGSYHGWEGVYAEDRRRGRHAVGLPDVRVTGRIGI